MTTYKYVFCYTPHGQRASCGESPKATSKAKKGHFGMPKAL